MIPSLPLVTPRLLLRPYEDRDFDDLYAFYSRSDVATYLYWEPGDAEKVRAVLAKRMAQAVWQEQVPLVLAVELKDEVKVVGEIVLTWRSQTHREGELGFVFHPESQGRGYAAEASRAMLELGFGTFDLHRIVGRCDARNTASARLMSGWACAGRRTSSTTSGSRESGRANSSMPSCSTNGGARGRSEGYLLYDKGNYQALLESCKVLVMRLFINSE